MNPPHASAQGGVWERKIGSVRRVLEGSLQLSGNRGVSRDEFVTLLAEAASIVNNTPLWAVSNQPDDPLPLSPASLLTLRSQNGAPLLSTFTEDDLLAYGPRRYRRVQYLADQFWTRWRQEYLQTLTRRRKWVTPRRCLAIHDIVLVRDRQVPRNHWQTGRVIEVKRSQDGLVRSVAISLPSLPGKNAKRIQWRTVQELVLLTPFEPTVVQEASQS